GAEIALHRYVPGFDVPAVKLLREGGGSDSDRQGEDVLVEVRSDHFRDTGAERARRDKAAGAGELGGDGGRVGVPQIAEGVRVYTDSAAYPQHGPLIEAVGDAKTRRQLAL